MPHVRPPGTASPLAAPIADRPLPQIPQAGGSLPPPFKGLGSHTASLKPLGHRAHRGRRTGGSGRSPATRSVAGGSGAASGGEGSRCLKMRLSITDLKSDTLAALVVTSDSKSKGPHSHKTLLNVSWCAEGETCEGPLGTR